MTTVLRGTMAPQAISYLGYGLFGLPPAVSLGRRTDRAIFSCPCTSATLWPDGHMHTRSSSSRTTARSSMWSRPSRPRALYTRGHSERVATASVMIARQIGMREDRVSVPRYAGILHYVAKLGVPTRVLQKSGKLTDEEYEAIKLDPVRGLEVVPQIEFLGEAYAWIMHHHERIDGRGYPMGLTGYDILKFARVIAVADAFDSDDDHRSYRDAGPIEDCVELHRCAGSQFDPAMVAAMVRALEAEEWAP